MLRVLKVTEIVEVFGLTNTTTAKENATHSSLNIFQQLREYCELGMRSHFN